MIFSSKILLYHSKQILKSCNIIISPEIWVLEYYFNLYNSKKDKLELYASAFPQQQKIFPVAEI